MIVYNVFLDNYPKKVVLVRRIPLSVAKKLEFGIYIKFRDRVKIEKVGEDNRVKPLSHFVRGWMVYPLGDSTPLVMGVTHSIARRIKRDLMSKRCANVFHLVCELKSWRAHKSEYARQQKT